MCIIKTLVFLVSLIAGVGVRGIATLSMPVKLYDDISVWREVSRKAFAKETDCAVHLPRLLSLSVSLIFLSETWIDPVIEECIATRRVRAVGKGFGGRKIKMPGILKASCGYYTHSGIQSSNPRVV